MPQLQELQSLATSVTFTKYKKSSHLLQELSHNLQALQSQVTRIVVTSIVVTRIVVASFTVTSITLIHYKNCSYKLNSHKLQAPGCIGLIESLLQLHFSENDLSAFFVFVDLPLLQCARFTSLQSNKKMKKVKKSKSGPRDCGIRR